MNQLLASLSSSFSLFFPRSLSPLFYLFLLSFLFVSNAHKCGHDHNDTQPLFPPLETQEDLTLKSCDYPALRIRVDASLVEEGPLKNYLTNELLPPVVDYFQAALKIKRPFIETLKVSDELLLNNSCNLSGSEMLSEGAEADFVLVLTTANMTGDVVGTSFICYRSTSGRPVIAKMRFNSNNFTFPNGNALLHEKNMYLTMHEMIHALGFGKSSFKHYIDENGNKMHHHFRQIYINGEPRNILDVEPLTKRLRKHIGCDSIPGMLLENDGPAGTKDSHFERRMFLNEVMTSGMLFDQRVSEFSLAALEGSGWYEADYSYAEPFYFGQGQGCDFWNGPELGNNTSTAEYCSEGEYEAEIRGCTSTGRGGGRCVKDFKTEGYAYYKPVLFHDCENSAAEKNARLQGVEVFGRETGSKCFSGTLASLEKKNARKTSFCFTYKCQGEGLDAVLKVRVGDRVVTCRKEGPANVKGFSGELMCPDPLMYCNTIGKQYCPRNCMGRGECMGNGQCKCEKGFGGVDCSVDLSLINGSNEKC